ncbi:MAG: MotA/TolQ/ExbB proton channel family protein [Planctomycetota bacterium]|nr:MotA/TolQ/ExbB proton channel family protein [Planctomycetota bacterium]MDA1137462.1 MotA/TolQ/ExbB proton channel family protein [Planctomycetota bacterium]
MQQLLTYYNLGGPLMHPLLLCSLISVAVIIERALRLRRSSLIDPAVVEDIQAHIEEGKAEMAVAKHHNSPSLAGRILSRALEEYLNTSADIETSLVESGERGLQVLNNNMSVLNLIARIAPLIGLLGTVIGMILGFEALEDAGVGKEELASAIKVALLTTATGLIVAIPTIIGSTYFRSKIRRLQAEFEEIFIDVIKTVKATSSKASAEEKNDAVGQEKSTSKKEDDAA